MIQASKQKKFSQKLQPLSVPFKFLGSLSSARNFSENTFKLLLQPIFAANQKALGIFAHTALIKPVIKIQKAFVIQEADDNLLQDSARDFFSIDIIAHSFPSFEALFAAFEVSFETRKLLVIIADQNVFNIFQSSLLAERQSSIFVFKEC